MGINERGINESINETIGDARVGERQTKCFAYRRVYYSAVVKHFFYFLSIFLRCESQAKRTLHLKNSDSYIIHYVFLLNRTPRWPQARPQAAMV